MPLNLHQDCQARLRALLAEQLSHVEVRHGLFLSPASSLYLFLAQAALPQTGKQHERLRNLIGEAPLVDFINGVLSRELQEGQEFQAEEGPVPLRTISGYEDERALAERLVLAFESLPWRYALTIQLPEPFSAIFSAVIGQFELTDTARIVCGTDALSRSHPLVSGNEKRDRAIAGGGLAALLIPSEPKWEPRHAYLQVDVDGYIGKFGNAETLLNAVALVRAFFGLGIALRLFKLGSSYQPYQLRQKAYVHRFLDDQWIVEDVHELDARHSEVIRDLQLHDLDGALDDDAKRGGWMRSQLSLIASAFASGDGAARSILLGSQWLLDSLAGDDELLQYVQAAVVVEILLGDKVSSDLTGLGELLANRCAYLIASTHSQRAEVLRDFRAIYEVRSKIVHRGKSRLLLGERTLFNKLRWMCRRIIQEEVDLLASEKRRADA